MSLLLQPVKRFLRPVRHWLRTNIPPAGQSVDIVQERDRLAQQLAAVQAQLHQAESQLAQLNAKPDPRRGPSIFLCTLPKSGSIYLLNILGRGLGYMSYNVSLGYFPRDIIDSSRLKTSAQGGAITQSHLDASPVNLQMLRYLQPRLQVHLRDPRQATLSMTHHLQRYWNTFDHTLLLNVEPCPPNEFFAQPLERQLDWMIDNYLPRCVDWMREWLHVVDGRQYGVQVLLTTYEEMLRNEDQFLERIMGFFGIEQARFTKPHLEKSMASHFRQGTADEWQRVFSAEQRQRALQIVPAELRDRFAWPK